ncbi:MAG: ABC transporter ATP-binding protein [Candidatus Hodarchaeales archaeon]|jgi:putative ABC transport system ATP-binding protein
MTEIDEIFTGVKKMNDRKTVVAVKELTKIFNMKTYQVNALNKITFDIQPGEFVGLIGISGSGKTTLINILAGLLLPTSGNVVINGSEITKMTQSSVRDFRLRNLGMVFQEHLLVESLTAIENVELPLIFASVPTTERRQKALELMTRLGLEDKINNLPAELSGGEQQRVGVARSLIFDPPLVLADEPTGDLDTKTGLQIIEIFKELVRNGERSVIMVSHDPRHQSLFDRVLQMSDGCLI